LGLESRIFLPKHGEGYDFKS